MLIAAHLLAYNVNDTLKEVIENISPYVDKIYIAYSKKSFKYKLTEFSTRRNPTTLKFVENCSLNHNVEIIKGEWDFDEDARNACFNKAKNDGFDWLIQQDADEFYDDRGWDLILRTLKDSKKKYYKTTWYNFWKSTEYVIQDHNNKVLTEKGNCAVRCLNYIRFIRGNIVNVEKDYTIDARCYHYGYVRSDEQIEEKINTWSHSHQFNQNEWYKNKWLNWRPNTINLHPVNPTVWKKAIKFNQPQPYFSNKFKNKIVFKKLTFKDKLNNYKYDLKYSFKNYLKNKCQV